MTTGLGGGWVIRPEDLAAAKQQAIKYLKTMPEGTQIAILKLANGLSVVQGFTSDRNVLLAAIDSVTPEEVAGAHMPLDAPYTLDDECSVSNRQSDITTAALAAVAGFVSGIKGRKNLIWFTRGFPWLTNYRRFSAVRCLRDDSPQLQNAYSLLNAARVAVYPIYPKGLQSCISADALNVPCTADTLAEDHGAVCRTLRIARAARRITTETIWMPRSAKQSTAEPIPIRSPMSRRLQSMANITRSR